MYLHIGNNVIINKENIIFILDYENLKDNKIFKEFYEGIDKNNKYDISEGKAKSIIITKENNIIKAYISNISSTTIAKIKF